MLVQSCDGIYETNSYAHTVAKDLVKTNSGITSVTVGPAHDKEPAWFSFVAVCGMFIEIGIENTCYTQRSK